jgi:uncharacterized protein YjbI with pentapeptide repeats
VIVNLLKCFENLPRPAQLLLTVIATLLFVLAVDGLRAWDLSKKLFFPEIKDVADVRFWSALVYGLAFGLGLPVAFLLWHWRDRNVRDQIENTRKDLNLREFDSIQVRLAGAVDDSISEKSKIALQTSALFQMSAFLSGERGSDFTRTAFEAIRAKYAADFEELFAKQFKRDFQNVDRIYDKIINSRYRKYDSIFKLTAHFGHDLAKIRESYQKDMTKWMNRRFFIENYDEIFLNNENSRHLNISLLNIFSDLKCKKLNAVQAIGTVFSGDRIDIVNFSSANLSGAVFRETTIAECDFQHARVDLVRFRNSTLENCNFTNAMLRKVSLNDVDPLTGQLRNSKFFNCKFNAADLTWVWFGEQDFSNTDFSFATLVRADFGKCDVTGANFANCDMRGANMTRIDPRMLKSCENAIFDDFTQFHLPARGTSLSWTQEQLVEIRNLWRSCGAKHINDSQSDDIETSRL